jgi:aminomethyltransferase
MGLILQRTPLFSAHQKLGGKMIDFGGWEMPVQYSSIVDEHLAVRRNAGIFDISHMGEVLVSGAGALGFLNRTLTNDASKLAVGDAQYSLMCNERGGTIDDLYVYRTAETEFLLIINASRIEPDVAWLTRLAEREGNVSLKNVSGEFAAVAVQGPRVIEFIDKAIPGASRGGTRVSRVTELQKNQVGIFSFGDQQVYVARTGYTGEDGFEVVTPSAVIEPVWDALLASGHAHCLQPCGLGARDTLRTEVCYPLYGHELDEQTSPIEAGVGYFVALDKGDFVGRSILAEQKAKGVKRRCVAFKATERAAPPRPGYPLWSGGSKVGLVTSGTQSPSLSVGIGLGYVPPESAKAGTAIEIEIRGKRTQAVIVAKPIYRKDKKEIQ